VPIARRRQSRRRQNNRYHTHTHSPLERVRPSSGHPVGIEHNKIFHNEKYVFYYNHLNGNDESFDSAPAPARACPAAEPSNQRKVMLSAGAEAF
jgi:hypothetical protein